MKELVRSSLSILAAFFFARAGYLAIKMLVYLWRGHYAKR
nr:MAG TPA: hypothetical protein [Caudoviricetes sp.]